MGTFSLEWHSLSPHGHPSSQALKPVRRAPQSCTRTAGPQHATCTHATSVGVGAWPGLRCLPRAGPSPQSGPPSKSQVARTPASSCVSWSPGPWWEELHSCQSSCLPVLQNLGQNPPPPRGCPLPSFPSLLSLSCVLTASSQHGQHPLLPTQS